MIIFREETEAGKSWRKHLVKDLQGSQFEKDGERQELGTAKYNTDNDGKERTLDNKRGLYLGHYQEKQNRKPEFGHDIHWKVVGSQVQNHMLL